MHIHKMECVITAVLSYIWKPQQEKHFLPISFFFLFHDRKKVSLIYEALYETIFLF